MAAANSPPPNETINIYFIAFNATGLPNSLMAMVIVRWIIAMVGFVLNASLLYVAVGANSLQGTCNFLIAFNAFCLVVLLPFMGIGLVIVLTDIPDFIPIQNCFWWQLVPMFFGSMFIISMFAIAVDRLLSILFSLWHSRLNKNVYLACVLMICNFYSAYVVLRCYEGVTIYSHLFVFCVNPGENYQGSVGDALFRLNLSVIILCILCYVLIWIVVLKNGVKWTGTFTHKILKSLSAMILLISAGFLLSTTLRVVAPFVGPGPFALIVFGTSMISVTSMAANAPVLYFFSKDYRDALRKSFPHIFNNVANFGSHAMFTRVAPIVTPQQNNAE